MERSFNLEELNQQLLQSQSLAEEKRTAMSKAQSEYNKEIKNIKKLKKAIKEYGNQPY